MGSEMQAVVWEGSRSKRQFPDLQQALESPGGLMRTHYGPIPHTRGLEKGLRISTSISPRGTDLLLLGSHLENH